MSQVIECDRCSAKIVEEAHTWHSHTDFVRHTGELGEYESDHMRLCSMCLDDLWDFAFETEVDRSDKADPIPLKQMAVGVERHIDELEDVLGELR